MQHDEVVSGQVVVAVEFVPAILDEVKGEPVKFDDNPEIRVLVVQVGRSGPAPLSRLPPGLWKPVGKLDVPDIPPFQNRVHAFRDLAKCSKDVGPPAEP